MYQSKSVFIFEIVAYCFMAAGVMFGLAGAQAVTPLTIGFLATAMALVLVGAVIWIGQFLYQAMQPDSRLQFADSEDENDSNSAVKIQEIDVKKLSALGISGASQAKTAGREIQAEPELSVEGDLGQKAAGEVGAAPEVGDATEAGAGNAEESETADLLPGLLSRGP